MTRIIRPAHQDDAADMVAILAPIVARGTDTIMTGPIAIEPQRAFIDSFPERGVFLVAEEHGTVVGMQDVQPASAEPALAHVGVISTFVAESAQGRGVGRALTGATITAARDQGFRKLTATIRADNEGALGFYERMGFTALGVARQHARVGDRFVDEVMMERWIG